MELALYAPGAGFYESGNVAFTTSAEASPLFGAVLATALDKWWRLLGSPDPFVVVEVAAGRGRLCRALLDASPECVDALRYVMVERSEHLRSLQPGSVAIEPASDVLGPVAPPDEETDEGARVLPGRGPRVASLPEMPVGPLTGVVLANELLDNLPFVLLEWSGTAWMEVRVGASLEEVLVPAAESLVDEASRLVPAPTPRLRIPLQHRAGAWLREALRVLDRGRIVAIDYAVESTAALVDRPWLRTYRGGMPGAGPLVSPGYQDITADVCVDQLARVRPVASNRSQAEFLRAHGLDAVVDEARAASLPSDSLDALKARSRVLEAAALVDPAGMGDFRVLEWEVP